MPSSGQDTDIANMNSQVQVSDLDLYKNGPNSQHGWKRGSGLISFIDETFIIDRFR